MTLKPLLAAGLLVGLGSTAMPPLSLADGANTRSAPVARVERVVLDAIVQPIETVTEFPDHRREFNIGSGFIVGRYFLTVHHNIRPSRDRFLNQTSTVDGIALRPMFVDAGQDIAVFELPESLCAHYCNRLSVSDRPALEPGRPVYWLRKYADEKVFKQSVILNLAALDALPSETEPHDAFGCASNLVVEIGKPFVAGSSGSPVVDAITGEIIGIIQGSFEAGGEKTGYFKPIHCVDFQPDRTRLAANANPG